MLEFPIKGDYTIDDVKKAQKRILQIAISVRDILDKYEIPYFIGLGTLIGAVRHQGFIPWDMDFDMFVEDKDYERAVHYLKQEIPNWLVVQDYDSDPGYCGFWVKIVDRYSEIHSSAFPNDNYFKYKGLHVDVYKLTNTTVANREHEIVKENLAYYKKRLNKGFISKSDYDEISAQILREYSSYVKNNHEQNDREILIFLRVVNTSRDAIYPLKKYLFEGTYFKGPHDYDKALKDCSYSTHYMVIPDFEERDSKIDRITFLDVPV